LSSEEPKSHPPETASEVAAREDHLVRRLSSRQVGMIALGGAIGTGFFLGSGVSVRLAGPGVIVSYLLAGLIALVIAWALAEMAVVHPVAGSFGVYAEIYLHPWAGFAMRYSYWVAQSIAIGSEVVAAAIYCGFWFPGVPGWLWVVAFSAGLLVANAWSVASFGEFEYWFALIKVVTIIIFLITGVCILFGYGLRPALGFGNYTRQGGFLPNGWTGVVLAMTIATFSYFGVEEVAVTAGEARDPERSIPRATRSVFWRLGLFYVGGTAVLVGLIPWPQVGLDASPFVRAFQAMGLRAAPTVMNLVVLTAALSSANTNVYLNTRMLYSLSHGGYAPAWLGRLTRRGIPLWGLLASSGGMAAAVVAQRYFPQHAYLSLVGAAFFGGLFVWTMILLTHLRFRRACQGGTGFAALLPAFPYVNWLALVGLAIVAVSTWFVPGMRVTLLGGLPWLGLISLVYVVWRAWRVPGHRTRRAPPEDAGHASKPQAFRGGDP
jgi:AAT family amino acid transporter